MAGAQDPVRGLVAGRLQRSAEETWDENARKLAADVIAAADRVGAPHVIVSGDVRARSMLLERLTIPLRESAAVVDKEVSADSQAMAEAAEQALSNWADRDCRERFDAWGTQLAHDRAVEGLAETMTALRNGQVSDVFLADDPHLHRGRVDRPWRHRPRRVPEELLVRGVTAPVADRADAAIVRAIARTDAELHFLPADLVVTGDSEACGGIARPLDGMCATLRFSLESG